MLVFHNNQWVLEKEAKVLIDAIGGKENVSAVTTVPPGCVLYFDREKLMCAIEEIELSKDLTNAGQFQVIIEMMPIFYTILQRL